MFRWLWVGLAILNTASTTLLEAVFGRTRANAAFMDQLNFCPVLLSIVFGAAIWLFDGGFKADHLFFLSLS